MAFIPPSPGIYDTVPTDVHVTYAPLPCGPPEGCAPPVYVTPPPPPPPVYTSYSPPFPPPTYVSYPPPPPPKRKHISYAPLIVYIVLVIIWLLFTIFTPNTSTNSKWITIFSGLFWAVLWAMLIYFLCRKGHTGWAWFLALFSLIIWAIVLILIFVGWIVLSI